MITSEEFMRYFWHILGIIGVVFFWAGVWDGIGYLPYIKNPWLSLLLGLLMLSFSGLIRKEVDAEQKQHRAMYKVLNNIKKHPQKDQFHVKYFDKVSKKHHLFNFSKLHALEKGFLIFTEKGSKEIFIPVHRVVEVLHRGKTYKKL